jgi:hypothetical protein
MMHDIRNKLPARYRAVVADYRTQISIAFVIDVLNNQAHDSYFVAIL